MQCQKTLCLDQTGEGGAGHTDTAQEAEGGFQLFDVLAIFDHAANVVTNESDLFFEPGEAFRIEIAGDGILYLLRVVSVLEGIEISGRGATFAGFGWGHG